MDEIKSSSLKEKSFLLIIRIIRRFCSIIPLILFELIFPLILFLTIIYISHNLLNNSINSNSLFDLNENEKCSQNPFQKKSFIMNCFNDSLWSKYLKINFIIRYLNKTNSNFYLFNKLINEIKKEIKFNNCFLLNKTNIVLSNNLSANHKFDKLILFNKTNSLSIIIDIDYLSINKFIYNIILPMFLFNKYKYILKNKIDYTFLQRHQHPSEQIDLFKGSFPLFIFIKIFFDKIALNLILNEESRIEYEYNINTISCTLYRHHKTIPTRWSFILMEILLSIIYLLFYLIITNLIIEENNKKIKEILKLIYIQPIMNYLSYAFIYFIQLSFTTFSIIGLWKISIGGWTIFEYVSSEILISFFTLINFQLISYSILMGQLFESFSRLFIKTIIIWVIMNILSFRELNQIYQIILCLNPYFSFIFILRHLFIYERSMNYVHLNRKLYRWSPNLFHLFLIIFLSIPFYWIFIWYFEKIFPGEYGIGLTWKYPFSLNYWKSILLNKSFESLSEQSEYNQSKIIVQVESLTKYFPETNRTIINNISFNLYQNQITALLGHNGAGKTTLMNMLCGFYEQTDGTIQICNYETRSHIDYLPQLISYCPQHDILFDLLTVQEQIEFYAIARGFFSFEISCFLNKSKQKQTGYSNEKENICSNLLEQVNLINDRTNFCKNLSGGMKRRLSIACTFIGNAKFILLDEPSSGVDPINRRYLWQWVRSMKENRSILFSTHFMEEADALSDKIIILSNGNICANNTSRELKQIYGTGYKLILNTNNKNNHIYLLNFIKNYLIKSIIEFESNSQLIIQTNEQSSKLFIDLLYQLEIFKEEEFILNYGLSSTSLDDVFLRLTIDQNEKNDKYEENEDFIEEDCLEIFNKNFHEKSCEFYLSQYEALFIKSFRIMSRKLLLLLFILLIPFFIQFKINEKFKISEINIDIDDLSHLKEQNIFIGINENRFNQKIFDLIQNEINQYSPLTKIYYLSNITNIQQLDYFYWKMMKNPLIGSLIILLMLIFIELIDLVRIIILIMMKNSLKLNFFYWLINILFPSLNGKRLIGILLIKSSKSLCKFIENDQNLLIYFQFNKEISENNFSLHLFIFLIQIIFLFIILLFIDTNIFNQLLIKLKEFLFKNNQLNKDEDDDEDEDEDDDNDSDDAKLKEKQEENDDVLNERNNLLMENNFSMYPIVLIDIIKKYSQKKSLAINNISFSVHQGECFGLLGFNGAGKTSLFKIIVGQEKATNGSIYMYGKKIHKMFSQLNSLTDIGYCPQYDCIQDKLTLEDYFYLFGRLRGIYYNHLKKSVEILSKLFLLDSFLKQYISQLSGGTIRRMHAALACIGSPSIILLDEPTTGVDPYSRRKMRRIFENALKNKLTIILTSHSMEECEFLCSRIGIMSKGAFKCLGFIQDLKRKFSYGYTINIKINSNSTNSENLFKYLNDEINIKIHHKTESTIILQVNHSSLPKLFDLIEKIKETFSIETYFIQQTTLEEIFLSFQ
ncbi:unnamed protein product [Rotaria magnacalcarata]|uniref:ABC transporter domain-containing protein n=1 Tax=Rotaria magnacalcarata TaxID=392030 RepID=A0A816YEG5_9BILA|nr:unnamed protein product [Rotaria magnacalcarata]